jgi:DNA gyrase subunit A
LINVFRRSEIYQNPYKANHFLNYYIKMEESVVEKDKIEQVEIEKEMKKSYLDYAMSVIVGRALPDVRDGLKPVHRRVLFTMQTTGLTSGKPFKKSANVVGNCMAKFHPHGDSAIYDTLVRMAQPFSLRYPLVNGQGNFGSIDGDSAAAMRYTEAKMQKLSEELMADIDKETVDFVPTFDDSDKEPSVLPTRVPNLLINGSSGIAVGMATNIAPHNLSEVCGAVIATIDNPEIEVEELMNYVKGPDFPTGGIILGKNGIHSAFKTGRGRVITRAKYHVVDKKNRQVIIVTEIPYMVNKSLLLEGIANLVKEKKVEGISDLRDESSEREGIRIVIELKAGASPEILMNQLFKHTRLQETFGVNMLALVDNEPKTLGLKNIIEHFIEHRRVVITRRTEYELRQAKARAHILEGLLIALDHIDEVIKKIRASKDGSEAQQTLMDDYNLSDKQAKAILEMRLQKLASLEIQKIKDEYEQIKKIIIDLEEILADSQRILNIIKEETNEIKDKYGDDRRTKIDLDSEVDIDIEDLITSEDNIVAITHSGYAKRMELDTYREQKRGGRGVIATGTKEDDFVEEVFIANTHDYLMLFTNKGKVHWIKVYNLPLGSRTAKGTPMVNFVELDKEERIYAVLPVSKFEGFFTLVTKFGTIKRMDAALFKKPRRGGIIALSLEEGDELIKASMTTGKEQLMVATKKGQAVRFDENDVRPSGRTAKGVRAIKLKGKDEVIGMVIAKEGTTLLTVTENGYGKRTSVEDYRLINRGGSGVRNILCSERNGGVVAIKAVEAEDSIVIISQHAIAIRMKVKDISIIGRNTQGVRLMRLSESDNIAAVAKVVTEEDEPEVPVDASSKSEKENESTSDNT